MFSPVPPLSDTVQSLKKRRWEKYKYIKKQESQSIDESYIIYDHNGNIIIKNSQRRNWYV